MYLLKTLIERSLEVNSTYICNLFDYTKASNNVKYVNVIKMTNHDRPCLSTRHMTMMNMRVDFLFNFFFIHKVGPTGEKKRMRTDVVRGD